MSNFFRFNQYKGQAVSHFFKQGICTYNFALFLECHASNYSIKIKNEYSLLLTMYVCNEIDEHSIGISEASHGVGPKKI